MQVRKLLLFFIFLSSELTLCAQETYKIILISTNDVHGSIDNFSKLAFYVNALKKKNKDVFVLNAGDLINGNPVVDQANEKGYPIFDLMNTIPYNVSCLGNHEFENGEAVLQKRIDQSSSVYVCANIRLGSAAEIRPIKPYTILHTSNGTSICVLGLTANSSNPCLVKNITMESYIPSASRYQSMRDSVDIFMALTHIGFKADSLLATSLKGLDLIIGGHSHTELPTGKLVNSTLITQAGDKLRFIGETVLTISNQKIIDKTFRMIDIETIDGRDSMVQAKIDLYNSNLYFKKVAGYSSKGFANKEEIGCLKTDALKDILKLDIAFDHSRNISWSQFPKGNITIGAIYEWDSYDYHTLKYDLKPKQIRQLILNSLKGSETPPLFVSGITYAVIKNTDGSFQDIVLRNAKGLLEENLLYSVGMNSFIACQFMKGIDAKPTDLVTTSASALISFLAKHKKVDYSNAKHVSIQ